MAIVPSFKTDTLEIFQGDNLKIMQSFPKEAFQLIYIDPPFNTGKTQVRTRLKTDQDANGDRVGFQGKRYKTTVLGSQSYADCFRNYTEFLEPRLRCAYDLLSPTGSLFFHIDYREAHYCKILLDQIFGRESFMNEIVWVYDFGARSRSRWSAKHDTIFWYAKDPNHYTYNYEAIDRIPYLAPGLVGREKTAKGKTPTDVWWHTIVSPMSKEKTGYPTQKPLAILNRIIAVHSHRGDRVLDFFAGSGTTGEAAARAGRYATLIDISPKAIDVMKIRLACTTYVARTKQRKPAHDTA